MPTISKIPMMGYSPISHRKLNQKASNPISANAQDSSSLNMSPNAHYGRHAVSFKAHTPLPLEEAEHFVTNFNFVPNMYRANRGNNQDKVIHDTASKLLHIAIDHQDTPSLKENAIKHFLGLLNHEDPDVQKGTIDYMAETTGRECAHVKHYESGVYTNSNCPHTSVVSELIGHILPRLNTPPVDTINTMFGKEFVTNNTAEKVTEIINNCLKIKPQLLNSRDNRQYLFNHVTNPANFKNSLDIITNAGEGDPEFAKKFTPQCINEFILPFFNYAPKEALPYLGRIAKVNPEFVTHDFINTHILPLSDNKFAVAKLCAINDFAEANPRIVTHDLINKTKAHLSSTDSYARRNATRALSTFTKVNPGIATDERHGLMSTAKNIFETDPSAYVRLEAKELISQLKAAPAELESKMPYPMIEAAPAELESKRSYPIPEATPANFGSITPMIEPFSQIPDVDAAPAALQSNNSPRTSESEPKLRRRDRARQAIGALFHSKKKDKPRTDRFFS